MKNGIKFLTSLLVLGVMGLLLFPTLCGCKDREKARRVSCASNLKQIGLGIMMYAEDNDNLLPNDITKIAAAKYLATSDVFVCPSKNDATLIGYKYYGQDFKLNMQNAIKLAIAADKQNNHDQYINTLYLDGHVEGHDLKKEQWGW